MSKGIQSGFFAHCIRSKIKEELIQRRNRSLCVCLSYLGLFMFLSQFKALVPAGLSFSLCHHLRSESQCSLCWFAWTFGQVGGHRGAPGSGHQRLWSHWCLSRGVSLNLNAFLGVFTHAPVIAVISYMHTRHHDSLLKIQEAPFSRTDKGSEQALLIHHR